jgi:hypothetical protein
MRKIQSGAGGSGMINLYAALMSATNTKNSNPLIAETVDVTPKQPPLPKGCQRYFFDKYGNYWRTEQDCSVRNGVAFQCIAQSKKSAIRKFDNFLKQHK